MIVDRCAFNYELSKLGDSELPEDRSSGYAVVLSGTPVGTVLFRPTCSPAWSATWLDGSPVVGIGHTQPCGSADTQRAAVAMLIEALAKGT